MDGISNNFSEPGVWVHGFRPKGYLLVTGEDALTFLQGQFTQELRSSAARSVAYGLWLNQKGKVIADSFVLREATDHVWIMSVACGAAALRERLEAYIIADDVVIGDETEAWQAWAVGGPEAGAWLASAAGGVPADGEFICAGGGFVFGERRGAGAGAFFWMLPVGVALPGGAFELTEAELERRRIAAGIALVPQDIGIGDLPNESALAEVAVSYTKGCYLGQEVMARLKAMGTVRRKLVRVRGVGHGVPAVPCALLQGEKRVGELRSAVADGAGGFVGLAMVTKLGLDPGALLAPEPGGVGIVELVDIP